jgi:hypothetical protein
MLESANGGLSMIGRNVTVAAALTLLSFIPAVGKTYRAEKYLVYLELDRQGELHVTETVSFHFANGPFTYVYRNISPRDTTASPTSRLLSTAEAAPWAQRPAKLKSMAPMCVGTSHQSKTRPIRSS